MSKETCKWVIRPGTRNTFWAFTPCKPGFNYLSKTRRADSIRQHYEGRPCPICGKPIECVLDLIGDEIIEI